MKQNKDTPVIPNHSHTTPYSRGQGPSNQIPPHKIVESTQVILPIPPPHMLQQYDHVVPGSAKRFLEEPHIEAEHRRLLKANWWKMKLS